MENTYYLGLDMGSASLGWAVTDSEYHILKKHGESLWGVRLFDSASTAEERRTFRTSRRRLDRRNWRIQILQEIFAEEISKIDPGFFLRMKESKYYPEDKRDESGNCPELPYALFVDSGFTDKDFHREFPTIYHLRKWLMETEETPDIRLLYLAFHHMIKHRGHFLLSGDISKIKKFDSTFLTLLQNVAEEELDWNLEIDSAQISAIENILKNRNLTRSAKKSQLIRLSGAKTACEKAIFTLISGGTVKLSDIFGNDDLNESERPKISFSDSGYDDYIEAVTLTLGEQFYIIESAKAVYDWSVLADILGDSVSISAAKVKVYEKHKKDLMYLKKIVRSNLSKEDYKNIFVNTDAKLNNYCAYVGMTKKNGRKVSLAGKCCSQIEFYDFLKKNVLSKIDDTVIKEYLENEINCENFLPKQINKGNSVIPYQVHLFELKSILKNGPLGFMKYVEDYNSGSEKVSLDYESIENLYVSPAVKRQIWQTLKVVKEIRKCMGTDPKRIFVEMAREKQESKRTEFRKKQLLDLYRNCKEEQSEIVSSLEQREDHELRRDKLYLYYTQKGRCMYSGRPIDFEKLWDNNMYDIDHIYPQSRTMDDSLDNRVLVERKENELKEDIYPINPEIQKARKTLWKSLLDGGFISKKKYERLVRTTKFDENELAGFIERQIVETRQGTKIVADILKEAFPNSTIVYVKARTVSNFRQDFELMKVREMNDLHHAKDAYLNIVVGNSYYVKFTQNAAWYIKENPGRTYNLEEMFKPKKRGRVARDIVRNGEIAWKAGEKGTIITVKKVMQKNNILVTRRSYEVKGGLFDQMIMKKGKGQIPIKSSDGRLLDINKYGGYNKATGAYFMLVKSRDKKGREIRSLEFVPLYLKNRIEQNEDAAIEYLEKDRGLKEPQIVLRKIRADTLFDVDGFKMWLSGRSGSQLIFKCANQLILSPNDEKCLKKILKFIQRRKENKNLQIYNVDGILEEDLLRLYDTFLDKLQNTMYKKRLSAQVITLTEKRNNFIKLRIEDKCIVLNEILHMFQSQSGCANLTLIGGPAKAGRIAMNSNITECKSISIINQSSSGIFEKKIDLLKL